MPDRLVHESPDFVQVVSDSPTAVRSRGIAASQTIPVTVSIARPNTHQPTFV